MKLLKDILEHKTGTSSSDFVVDGSEDWPPTAKQKKRARKKTGTKWDGYDPNEYEFNLAPLKSEERLNEFGPLSLIGMGAGAVAAHDIIKLHFSKKARDHREKLSRYQQRFKDRADPKSQLNKDMRRKQQTRNRHVAKIASTLEPGESTRRSFTKKTWAASDSKNSINPSRKGVQITRNSDGTIKVRYENTIIEMRGAAIHRNPSHLEVKSLLKNSDYNEVKGIVSHDTDHMHLWDGNRADHADVADKKRLKGKISAFTIRGNDGVMEHSGEWSSIEDTDHLQHATHEEFKKHPKIKDLVHHLGLEHEGGVHENTNRWDSAREKHPDLKYNQIDMTQSYAPGFDQGPQAKYIAKPGSKLKKFNRIRRKNK